MPAAAADRAVANGSWRARRQRSVSPCSNTHSPAHLGAKDRSTCIIKCLPASPGEDLCPSMIHGEVAEAARSSHQDRYVMTGVIRYMYTEGDPPMKRLEELASVRPRM